jgi:hypothetical protein
MEHESSKSQEKHCQKKYPAGFGDVYHAWPLLSLEPDLVTEVKSKHDDDNMKNPPPRLVAHDVLQHKIPLFPEYFAEGVDDGYSQKVHDPPPRLKKTDLSVELF